MESGVLRVSAWRSVLMDGSESLENARYLKEVYLYKMQSVVRRENTDR